MTGEDLLARAFLHETDHLNGKLYISHISALKRDLIRRKDRKLQKAPASGSIDAADEAGLSGHARVRGSHAGAHRRGRARGGRGVHAAGSSQGARAEGWQLRR